MKRTVQIIFFVAICICLSDSHYTNAQSKNNIVSINTGLLIPADDNIIGGYKVVGYNNEGSPVSLVISGFGTGGNLNISFSHYFSGIGLSLKSGVIILRQETIMSLAPNGEKLTYDNTLDIVPVELTLDYRIDLKETEVMPYFGLGAGFYYGSMENKKFPETGTRTWTKGSAFSGGLVSYSGLIIPMYHDLLLNLRAGYHIAYGNWELEDQDDQTSTRYEKLNTGGFTFGFGFAFWF